MLTVDVQLLRSTLLAALREDVGSGDITSRATIPVGARARGRYTAKQQLVVAGLRVIEEAAALVDRDLRVRSAVTDSDHVSAGTVLAEIHGPAASVLIAERTTLNILQRMCGIATVTRQFVSRIEGTRARIVDTRKTVPGLRVLDKYAVTCGGGMNHRMGLFDGVLIKNNHIAFHRSAADAIGEARRHVGHLAKIEVEISSIEDIEGVLHAGADVLLLDNFDPEQTRQAVKLVSGRVPIESSGGITLETVRQYAEAGVDYISAGALTHSVPAVDIHLRVTPE